MTCEHEWQSNGAAQCGNSGWSYYIFQVCKKCGIVRQKQIDQKDLSKHFSATNWVIETKKNS